MMDISKDAIAALLDGVTPGPWAYDKESEKIFAEDGYEVAWDAIDSDARFIAAARELVPAMAARIAELEAAASVPQVTVKPLVWEYQAPYSVARVFNGHYSIEVWEEGVALRGSFISGDYLTREAARAAAQADFDKLVSAFITITAPQHS